MCVCVMLNLERERISFRDLSSLFLFSDYKRERERERVI